MHHVIEIVYHTLTSRKMPSRICFDRSFALASARICPDAINIGNMTSRGTNRARNRFKGKDASYSQCHASILMLSIIITPQYMCIRKSIIDKINLCIKKFRDITTLNVLWMHAYKWI